MSNHPIPSYLQADHLGPWGVFLQQIDRVTPYLGELAYWVETLKRPEAHPDRRRADQARRRHGRALRGLSRAAQPVARPGQGRRALPPGRDAGRSDGARRLDDDQERRGQRAVRRRQGRRARRSAQAVDRRSSSASRAATPARSASSSARTRTSPRPTSTPTSRSWRWMMDTYSMNHGRTVDRRRDRQADVARAAASGGATPPAAACSSSAAQRPANRHGRSKARASRSRASATSAARRPSCFVAGRRASRRGAGPSPGRSTTPRGLDVAALLRALQQRRRPLAEFTGADVDRRRRRSGTSSRDIPDPGRAGAADHRGQRAAASRTKHRARRRQRPDHARGRRHPARARHRWSCPTCIANAGGVTVSYFEWVQDFSSFFWTRGRDQRAARHDHGRRLRRRSGTRRERAEGHAAHRDLHRRLQAHPGSAASARAVSLTRRRPIKGALRSRLPACRGGHGTSARRTG